MQQEIRFATFNVYNLALPGVKYYEDQEPYTVEEYQVKIAWMAEYLDRLDADIIGFQEIFSQSALRDVLALTKKYQQATHIGFEPLDCTHLTPSVALISRLPVKTGSRQYSELPENLQITIPGSEKVIGRFTRPVLYVPVELSTDVTAHVFVCHLKSKRPDFVIKNCDNNPDHADLGALRALYRRGAEALGIRRLVNECLRNNDAPVVVMGDFNDVAGAVSTQLAMGGHLHEDPEFDSRLYESYRIQTRRDPLRDVGYTHVHEGSFETVDHVLVSRHFNPSSANAIGQVSSVVYLNDHVAHNTPGATDHGLVLVKVHLHATTAS